MLDFVTIATRSPKNGVVHVYPKFKVGKSSDLMIRGGDFYAVWIEELGLWSTDEDDVIRLIDRDIKAYYEDFKKKTDDNVKALYLWDAESGMIDVFHKYCQRQMRDSFQMLDEKLVFSNTQTTKKDYASKKLTYPLEPCDTPAYERLISTLYSEEERRKIEWSIGAIISGDSKKIQKFLVLYGGPGTGKSTILNIIQQLFDGYYSVFDAKVLGSSSNAFALEAFKTNPLVAIQHDGDLSRIEDNTRLNSLVSHEMMTVNEKFKSTYSNSFKAFLYLGTNKPVKITDGKSGLIRRLIDVSPSGNKVPASEYRKLVKQIEFELGGIACHCHDVYLEDPNRYDDYIPVAMLGASNDFYNFIIDAFSVFEKEDGTTQKAAWEMYKTYCDEAKVPYPLSLRNFKEELKNYFWDFKERFVSEDGTRIRSYYSGFRTDKFDMGDKKEEKKDDTRCNEEQLVNITFRETNASEFNKICSDCPAQYATDDGTPINKWERVQTKLSEIDTSRLHYVKVPENHIVIDFDVKDENGNKSFEKNLEEASKWPATYAEVSKSGGGIHLHYIYTGDVTKLSRVYDDNIEVKVFTGGSSLRRKLTKCNILPIATISSGLPLKEGDKVINKDVVQTEKGLRTTIKKCLAKEVHAGTKPNVDFIYEILEKAYTGGLKYDVSDMKNAIFAFAAHSTNQADYCIKLVNKMHFKSEEASDAVNNDKAPIVFYDVEVFPNLFIVCYKLEGTDKPIVSLINPGSNEIEELLQCRLIGFNCRRYDNHILYARLMGWDNERLYNLSQQIINAKKGDRHNGLFGEAYNISYTDIYDFASAGNKMSLKKLEIEMGIHHQELGLPWDKPVPEDQWDKVADYCKNDVVATEEAFNYLKGDWIARQILADLTGLTVNDTTNTLSGRLVFGADKKPQSQFNYRDLSQPVSGHQYEEYRRKFGDDYVFRVFDNDGLPQYRDYIPGEQLPEGYSILPFFPGYKYEAGKSTYLEEEIGEGGRVYAEPGMYGNVWDADVGGMHPATIIAEVLFGKKYTKLYDDLRRARLYIKHSEWDELIKMFDGKLKPYVQKVLDGELTAKELSNALKTVLNSAYGLTSANFENLFRDVRNKDNIVAKRGALFMTLLKKEVQNRGFVVAHIKTDSIKIPDATEELKEFVINFGKEFGYEFETEAEFDRFCLVNNAVYIAKTKQGKWTATGAQFAVPYVFKKLFTKEALTFDDFCETKSVKTALYLDMNEGLPEDEHNYRFIGKVSSFTPIKPNCGGGQLLVERTDADGNVKYDSVVGTTGYRWLESEIVRGTHKEQDVDMSYYDEFLNAAIYGSGRKDTKQYKPGISDFGDFEWFVSGDPYIGPNYDEQGRPIYSPEDDLPWYDVTPFDVR